MAISAGKIKQFEYIVFVGVGVGVCGSSTYLYCVHISLLTCE